MPDQTVVLEKNEWQALMNILGTTKEHPWVVTNPLLMKIGGQLQAQEPQSQAPMPTDFPQPPTQSSNFSARPGDGFDDSEEALNRTRRVPRN